MKPLPTDPLAAMKGRRIPVEESGHPIVEQPGDYCGPVYGFTGDLPAVFFLKPNALILR
jgi:hypothetical protein